MKKFKRTVITAVVVSMAVSLLAALGAAAANEDVPVTPEKTAESVHWTISSDTETAEARYDYSDTYADISLVLNTEAGDKIDADGLYFAGTAIADSSRSAFSKISQNKRYILFMPKYDGNLDISAVFSEPNGSRCRVYAIPLSYDSVSAVATADIGDIYKDNTQTVAAEAASNSATNAASKNIPIEANTVYLIVPYSYQNSPSTIKTFGYTSEFKEFDPNEEYQISAIQAEHGTVTFNKTAAKYNEDVTATVTADSGYEIGTLDINGTTVLATNTDNINEVTFKMPAKALNDTNCSVSFDETEGRIDINEIHDFDGGISGTSGKKSEILFDGIVNTNTVANSASVTYGTEDDLIIDAGDDNKILLSKIISYAKIGSNEKATFRVHASDTLDDITGTSTVILTSTAGASSSNAVSRCVMEADDYAKTTGYRYIRIKYTNSSVALSELKFYGTLKVNPPSVTPYGEYTDNMQLHIGRKNKIEGECYKIGNATFKLTDENNTAVWTKTEDLTGKTAWSVLIDAVNDSEGVYTFTAEYDGETYAEITGITFADLPLIKFGKEEYDGETVKVPVEVLAEDVNEKVSAYIAEYGADGTLLGAGMADKTISQNDTIEVEYTRKSPSSEIRLYLWNGMQPYTEPRYVYEDVTTDLSIAPGSVTYDSAAVVWDNAAGETDSTYTIYNGSTEIGTTNKLYYVAENLTSDTEYTLEVKKGGDSLGTVTFKTMPKGGTVDITDEKYGASADKTAAENTIAIQSAIDDCPKNGIVKVPAGTYTTGALFLHSDMTLYLDEGAELKGSSSVSDYLVDGHMIKSRFEGWELESYASLINAGSLDSAGSYNCRNISIRGKGTINGGGQALGNLQGGEGSRTRGRLISIHNCRNVNISGVTIKNPPCWTVHMVYSDRISTYDTTIDSKSDGRVRNGDGWDPDSSTNLMLFGSTFNTGDDCIAIKSGKNPEGNVINKPTKNVRIFNCTSDGGLGLAIGSEMSGGVENIYITDCDIKNTRYGLEMKATKKRGGYIRNIHVKNSSFDQILMHSVDYNDDGIGAKEMPYFSDMTFENVTVPGYSYYNGAAVVDTPIALKGFENEDNYIKNISFKNITAGDETNVTKKVSMQYCDNISFDNVKQTDGKEVTYSMADCKNISSKDNALLGKTVYDFGDSIVYGHNAHNNSFMNVTARDYGMSLTSYSKNGASVVCVDSASKEDASEETSGNYIIKQVRDASSEAPDIIVFDGYTNDAYGSSDTENEHYDSVNADGSHINIWDNLGTMQGSGATEFDNKTFCGAFEQILYEMKQKWPSAKIVFVTIHKSGGRSMPEQTMLRELSMQMCEEWGVAVCDMFTYENADGNILDTTDSAQMKKYIINGKGSHPNLTAIQEFYEPAVAQAMQSLYAEAGN